MPDFHSKNIITKTVPKKSVKTTFILHKILIFSKLFNEKYKKLYGTFFANILITQSFAEYDFEN